MILTILPGAPERHDRYVSIRESLARALEELARPIEQIRELHLSGLSGAEKAAAADASGPLNYTAMLLSSHANALRDRELVDLADVHDVIERAGAALTAGIFLMRTLHSMFPSAASGKA